MLRKTAVAVSAALFTLSLAACNSSSDTTASNPAPVPGSTVGVTSSADNLKTLTPIKHVVVIYNENVSFDHYFGTYPKASNPKAEPAFTAAPGTPAVNNLVTPNPAPANDLQTDNGNYTNTKNGKDAANPYRLDRSQAATADQNHAYTAEQMAYDNGLADLFPLYTGKGTAGGADEFGTKGQVMGYFDGNTVTALWNYAQNYAMSDAAFTDTYGPSTPGALEVVAGQTNGMQIIQTSKKPFTTAAYSYYINDGVGGFTMINDVDP
ncbi:MAG: phospholipase, partial [Halothiobacillus sp. 28-55-5]